MMLKVAFSRALLVVLLLPVVTGCTTSLKVARVDTAANSGQVYFLPRVEHVVTLNRELTKCEVRATQQRLAQDWFKSEVANLDVLVGKLHVIGLAGKHPTCPQDAEAMKVDLGTAFETVKRLLPPVPPAACGAGNKAELRKAYEQVSRSLVAEFLADPIFVGGVDWGGSCAADTLKVLTFKADADVKARLDLLKACLTGFAAPANDVDVDLGVLMTAEVTAHTLPDLAHAYSIDYASMTSGVKQTKYTVEKYPNGTLKSINATINDRTGEVIQGAVRGALNILAATQGVPLGVAAAPPVDPSTGAAQSGDAARAPLRFAEWIKSPAAPQPAEPLCKASILQLLKQKTNLEAQAQQASATILAFAKTAETKLAEAEKAKAEAAELQKKHDAAETTEEEKKELKTKIEALKEIEKSARAAAEKAENDKKAFEEAQGGSIKALAKLRNDLTVTTTQMYKADPAVPEEQILGEAKATKAWFDNVDKYCPKLDCDAPTAGSREPPIPKLLKADMASYLPPKSQTAAGKAVACSGTPEPGKLVYREPVKGFLVVCQKEKCLSDDGSLAATPENTVLLTVADFPQRGVLSTLPLSNRPFQNNTLVANFSETGSLQTLTYESTASAQRAAEVFESTTGDVLDFIEAKRGAKKRDIETQTQEVNAETELLKAKKARDDAKKALETQDNSGATGAGSGQNSPEN